MKRKDYSKQELIRVMKQAGSRTVFRRSFPAHFQICKDKYPGLFEETLSVIEVACRSTGELTTKKFLEALFCKEFINMRPHWLINPKTNKSMELDGYCESLKIAFEYGSHTDIKGRNQNKIKQVLEKDQLKVEICKNNKVKLIVIPDIFSKKGNYELLFRTHLLKELKRLKITIPKNFNKIPFLVVFPKGSKYNTQNIWEIAKKCKQISDFTDRSGGAYDAARKLGIWPEIKAYFHKKNPVVRWNKDKVMAVVSQCKDYFDFVKRFNGAYKYAIRLNFLNEISQKLKMRQRPKNFWKNDDLIIEELKKCKSLKEFYKKNPTGKDSVYKYNKKSLIKGYFK